jgi:molybdopterin molybdotransferase
MDGFAVRFGALGSALSFDLVPGLVTPRSNARPLERGTAIAITTGARVPRRADSVVRKEWARVEGPKVWVRRPVERRSDIHARAEDLHAGDPILAAGEWIRPYHTALLLAQGFAKVPVRLPRVSILAIGDEIALGPARLRNRVRDTITPLITSLVPWAHWTRVGPVGDRLGALRTALRRAVAASDLVVTVGGTSVGERDLTKRAVASLGRLLFEGVQVNVLKRGAVGVVDGVPVVLLPGQVLSAVAVWHVHGLRVLGRLVGRRLEQYESVRLGRAVANPHPMDSVYPFRVKAGRAEVGLWGVRRYSQLLGANALGIIPRSRRLPAGSVVEVQRLEGAEPL